MTEYRVVWKRAGLRGSSRVFQRRGRAERLLALLRSDPHDRCDHTQGSGYCIWDLNHERNVTEPPPWEVEPRMDVRDVGPWKEDPR